MNGVLIVSQEHFSNDIPPEVYKRFGTIQITVRTMHVNLKTIFLCAGKVSVDQQVGIVAVRETTLSEPRREKYFEGLGSHVDEEFTGYQISVGRHAVSQRGIITSRQTTC
jgi:hypothetical protein